MCSSDLPMLNISESTHSLDFSLKASNSPMPRSASMRVEGGAGSGTGSGVDEEDDEEGILDEPSAMPLVFSSLPLPLLPLPPLLEAEHARSSGRYLSCCCCTSGEDIEQGRRGCAAVRCRTR